MGVCEGVLSMIDGGAVGRRRTVSMYSPFGAGLRAAGRDIAMGVVRCSVGDLCLAQMIMSFL